MSQPDVGRLRMSQFTAVAREQTYLHLFEEQRVQGVLITPFSDVLQRLEAMHSRGIPSVLVDRLAGSMEFCSVSVDEVAGGGQLLSTSSRAKRPDAVLAANDQLALGLLQSFTASGIKVPEEIAIIGIDGIDFASQSSIPLSSVRHGS